MHPPQLLFFCPRDKQRFLDEAAEKGRRVAAVQRKGGNQASHRACHLTEVFCTFFNSQAGSMSQHGRMKKKNWTKMVHVRPINNLPLVLLYAACSIVFFF